MSERPYLNGNLGPIALVSSGVVDRFISTETTSQWGPIQTINYIRQVMTQMPEGKTGIVLGSGQNTLQWKRRGWLTLDIDPRHQSDFILDANHLAKSCQNQFDFILAEYLTFNPLNQRCISPDHLLNQANKSLKLGGELIIKSTHFNNLNSNFPNRYEYPQQMLSHGFRTIVEIDDSRNFSNGQQLVTYYGRKIY